MHSKRHLRQLPSHSICPVEQQPRGVLHTIQTSQLLQAGAALALPKSRKQEQCGRQRPVQQLRGQQPLLQQLPKMGQLSDWAVWKCPPTFPTWEAGDQNKHKRYK